MRRSAGYSISPQQGKRCLESTSLGLLREVRVQSKQVWFTPFHRLYALTVRDLDKQLSDGADPAIPRVDGERESGRLQRRSDSRHFMNRMNRVE